MVSNLSRFRSPQKLLGIALLISFAMMGCGGDKQQARGSQTLPVKLQTLQPATLVSSSEYVGVLEAKQRVNLAPSRTSGRIVKIFVRDGDIVRQGQRLVELQVDRNQQDVKAAVGSLNVAKADLRAAEAELRQREAERDRAKAEVENARATLASIDSDVERVKADLVLADINYQRSKALQADDVVPKQDLDDKTRALNTTKAQLQSQKKTRDASQQSLNATIDSLRAAQKRVEQALANVDSRNSAVTEAQGQLGSVQEDLSYNFLYSPIDGVVGTFNEKKLGDNVGLGEAITTITDNKTFNLNVNIPTENRNRLRQGLPVEILNADGTPGVRGQITFISPLVEQNAQAVRVKMTFRNDGTLRDQQYVQLRVIWEQQPGVLVPTTAVSSLGGQKFVFVAQPGESKEGKTSLIAKQIPVEVGAIQGQSYQIISGLKPGDKIALNRILDLRDGRSIIEESAANQQSVQQ